MPHRPIAKSTIPSQTRFRAAPGIHAVWEGRHVVLVRTGTCRHHTLTGVASRIWSLLDHGAPLGVIIHQLRCEIGAPRAELELETTRVLARLVRAGLIERRG